MSKHVYEEALADIKKLKQVAEENAKKTLIEAVTPRIREFIEAQLLDYDINEEDDEEERGLAAPGSVEPHGQLMTDTVITPDPEIEGSISPPDAEGKVTLDLEDFDDNVSQDEDMDSFLGDDEYDEDNEDEYILNLESSRNIKISNPRKSQKIIEEKISKVENDLAILFNASKMLKESKVYNNHVSFLIKEINDAYILLESLELDFQTKLIIESKLDTYLEEIKNIQEKTKMRRRRLSEEDLTLKLTGLPEDFDTEELGVDLILDDEDEESDEDFESDDDDSESDDDDDDADMDMGEDDFDMESDESDEMSDDDEEDLDDDTVVEIDETELVEEIRKMRSLRESRTLRASRASRASRVNENRSGMRSLGRKARLLNERAERLAEKTESTKLRKKLAESNLFNTKLIYANKVLQNENLSRRQKANIIEKIDEASNPREVKLVFESSVRVASSAQRPLKESAVKRTAGSSSRVTRSSSATLNENVEANRWALLAGLK